MTTPRPVKPIYVQDAHGNWYTAYQEVSPVEQAAETALNVANRLFNLFCFLSFCFVSFWVVWFILSLTDSPIITWLIS